MPIDVLYPRFDHPAIEERYASWQTQMLLRRGGGTLRFFDADELASDVAVEVDSDVVLVVTDPLLAASVNLAPRLAGILGDAAAALPVTNEPQNPAQRLVMPGAYLTRREFEERVAQLETNPPDVQPLTWDRSDPIAYVCRTEMLDTIERPLATALDGANVVLSRNDYVHRWSTMRGQPRIDLLDRISTEARSVLEFGCGEAPLGAAIKQRQRCRVVGIEMDPAAAAIARKRIDDVYCGDVRHIVEVMDEQFDWIIGGDILEHLDEPWTFLTELRRISAKNGHLLLSLPNVANASVVGDLLQGRFDYVYMGITCVGHLRFFTRSSIEEMLDISGWIAEAIETQPQIITPPAGDLMRALSAASIPFSQDDLLSPGYYITARRKS